ncbi:Uncharacterized protein dnm_096370 [Desulfonema magnum]|uniref:Uncharacterized protein n=1 Tax=Desulfonema magnum TaxID=45655 RepID=A0A975BYX9_9BACT|nr:Uncharacterized protein dnm_096370 [Desulfonema magnum]
MNSVERSRRSLRKQESTGSGHNKKVSPDRKLSGLCGERRRNPAAELKTGMFILGNRLIFHRQC